MRVCVCVCVCGISYTTVIKIEHISGKMISHVESMTVRVYVCACMSECAHLTQPGDALSYPAMSHQ